MALNIRSVVYTDLPGQAKKVRDTSKEMDAELKSIYKEVTDLRKDWFGDRYNGVVEAFNKMIPDFNDIIDLLERELPSTLETVANNYSNVDRGQNITTVDNTKPVRINDIPASMEAGVRYIPANVEQAEAKIFKSFARVIQLMKSLQDQINKLSWESDASDKFRAEFTRLQNKISNSIEEVEEKFKENSNKTASDMAMAEKKSTTV